MEAGVDRDSISLAALALALAAYPSTGFAQSEQASVSPESGHGPYSTVDSPDLTAPPAPGDGSREITKTIYVTGSRIPRPNLTATSPVTVIGQEEIKLQGTTNTEEILNELPQVAPGQGEFISNGATGTATVDLRNMGPPRTLVLVNGRRLGPGDPTQPVADLDMVPPTLIKRIEVLTGGASSVYGSDAVSGVVNFILDSSLDGIRVDGQVSAFQHDNRIGGALHDALVQSGFGFPSGNTVDGGRTSIDVAAGKSLLDGRAHVSIYAGYRNLQALLQSSRDYSACAAQLAQGNNSALVCGGSQLAAFPGNFVTNFGFFQIGPGRTLVPGLDRFNFAPFNYYHRPDRRYTAGGFADIEVSDAIKPFLEVMYLNDRSVAQLAPSGDFFNTGSINCDNPLLSPQQLQQVCTDGNFVGQVPVFDDDGNLTAIEGAPTPFTDPLTGATYLRGVLYIGRRNVEGGARQQELTHSSLRLLGGAKGDVARGVTYEASFLYALARMRSTDTKFLSVPRLNRALDVVSDPSSGQPVCRSVLTGEDPSCVPWDVFALGAVTPEAVDYLQVSTFRHGFVREQVANLNSTVALGDWGLRSPWATEGPSLNFGAEYRRDKLSYVPDPLQFTGDLAGAGGSQQPANGSADAKEIFVEARLPIVDNRFVYGLALEAGYRRSWYSNNQSRVSAGAYKLAVEFAPVRGVQFRAGLQRAVRAPNIVELFTPTTPGGLGDDPCAGSAPSASEEQCALTGVTAAQYGHIRKLPGSSIESYNAIVGGNPDLLPETATTKTFGVVIEPRFIPGLSATIDWWQIKLNGAVAEVGADFTMQSCIETGDPLFCSRIHRDSSGSLWLTPQGFVDDRNINVGAFNPRGIDVGANFEHGIGALGSVSLSFLGTYYDRWLIVPGGLAKPFDCAGLYGGDCAIPQPRWKHKARLTWSNPDAISVSFNWRYTANMRLAPIGHEPGPFTKEIKAQSYFDMTAIERIGKNYSLRLGVDNIFDRPPPLVPASETACQVGCNGNTYPQWYDPLGRFIFAGFTVQM
jgi:outer membrane receptor protein involved in Fe transport